MPKKQQRDISMIDWPWIDSHRSLKKPILVDHYCKQQKKLFVCQYIGKRHTRCSLRHIVNDRTTALLWENDMWTGQAVVWGKNTVVQADSVVQRRERSLWNICLFIKKKTVTTVNAMCCVSDQWIHKTKIRPEKREGKDYRGLIRRGKCCQ